MNISSSTSSFAISTAGVAGSSQSALSASTQISANASGALSPMGEGVYVSDRKAIARDLARAEQIRVQHTDEPMTKATDAMQTVYDQLERMQQTIGKQRPSLANVNWDVALKDGKLKVSGDLSDADKAWLENKLNDNKSLVSAAQRYSEAVVTFYQGTPENLLTPNIRVVDDVRIYDKVGSSINGNLPLRAIAAHSAVQRKNSTGCIPPVLIAGEYLSSLNVSRYVPPQAPPPLPGISVGDSMRQTTALSTFYTSV